MKKKTLQLSLVVCVILLVIAGFVIRSHYLIFQNSLMEYEHVKIGASRDEVLYRLGYPYVVYGEFISKTQAKKIGLFPGRWQKLYYTDKNRHTKYPMPDKKSIDDFDAWGFSDGFADITVSFSATKVSSIECMDRSGASQSRCMDVAGISIGDTEEELIDALGEPSRFKYDGTTKTLRYDDLGVVFVLSKGKVYMISVMGCNGAFPKIFHRFLGL